MAQESSSFAADIRKFEETLVKDPSSYCFAPLAELYRKSGMLEEAISIAGDGTKLHPQYVGGFMALGRAYLDKGMNTEALEALQTVVSYTPDNMLAHKLLTRIYSDAGEHNLLKGSLEALVSLNPADAESRTLLESLRTSPHSGDSGNIGVVVELQTDDLSGEGLEELDLLDELEEVSDSAPAIIEPEEPPSWAEENSFEEEYVEEDGSSPPGIDTATIAELYAAQGHHVLALDIYRKLSLGDPGNEEFRGRISDLVEPPPEFAPPDALPFTYYQLPLKESCPVQETKGSVDVIEEIRETAVEDPAILDEQVVAMLQSWMDNIRRVRECRSGRD